MSYLPFRLEISGTLTIESPVHVGTGERLSLATDAPILMDGLGDEARPYIPGSSLRGVLRAHIEREAGPLGSSQEMLDRLFGQTQKNPNIADSWVGMGRLTVLDAYHSAGGPSETEIRDHVKIERKWGAAADGGKFDAEVVTGGSFAFFAAYEGERASDPELALLGEAVRLLETGELQVGAKSGWATGE